jgi:DHA1 family multidrug resistance protein-like MFS transporter
MTGAESHVMFLGLSALNGVGGAALWPNVFASVADVTTEEERVGAMSVFNMMYMIGIGGSAPLGSLIYRLSHGNPQNIFPATALLFVVGILFSAFLTPWLRGTAHHAKSGLPDKKHQLVWPVLIFFMAMSMFQTLGLQLMNGPLVLYVNQDLGLKEGAIGLPFLALAAVVAAVAIPIGAWGGRWGRVKSVKLGLALATLGMLLLPLHANITWWLAIAIPMIIGFLLSIPAWLAILTDLAPMAWRGRIYGYVATAQGFGAILGPTIGLYLFGEHSHGAPFIVSGLILGLTLVAAMFGLHENMRAVVDKPAGV